MIKINPVPKQKIPFQNPDGSESYFCNHCQEYSSAFSTWAINSEYRRCDACQKKVRAARSNSLTTIGVLKRRLYHNFMYNKESLMAQNLNEDHVRQILQHFDIPESDATKIKTISPNFDLIKDQWDYKVVFKKG